jgi:hypothetical protein
LSHEFHSGQAFIGGLRKPIGFLVRFFKKRLNDESVLLNLNRFKHIHIKNIPERWEYVHRKKGQATFLKCSLPHVYLLLRAATEGRPYESEILNQVQDDIFDKLSLNPSFFFH